MSADNGIYIGVFPKTENPHNVKLHPIDLQYRVIHATAIDNINFFDEQKELEIKFQKENPRAIVEYFGNADVLTQDKAQEKAFEMEHEIMDSSFPVLEYGISTIHFKQPFSFYQEHVKEIKYFWDKEEV